MFERFTDRARLVIVRAQEEARNLGHSYVGPEHILLGIFRQGDSVAAQVLAGLGANLDGARGHVVRLLDSRQRRQGNQAG